MNSIHGERIGEGLSDLTFDGNDGHGHKKRLGDILVKAGVLSSDQLGHALEQQESSVHTHLGRVLIDMGYTGEDVIREVLASQLGVRYVKLNEVKLFPTIIEMLHEELARRHTCVPITARDERLTLAMANPFDLIAIQDVEFATERYVEPVVATRADIIGVLDKHYLHSS